MPCEARIREGEVLLRVSWVGKQHFSVGDYPMVEEPKPKGSAIRTTLTEFCNALWHTSVLLVIASSILLSTRSRLGVLHFDVSALSSAIFAVAGTMVALILPAS